MQKKHVILISICLILILSGVVILPKIKKQNNTHYKEPSYINGEFNLNLIKTINKDKKENYLISPYSIEIALSMIKEGAKGNTLKEIEKVIDSRDINDAIIKDKISVANAAFIKSKYQKYISDKYYKILKDKYHSEILYDDFKTPKVINDWVNKKTNGMIEKILDNVDENFILGLANALAIDVEWNIGFDCNETKAETFTKADGKSLKAEMMHKTFNNEEYQYLKDQNATGIIIPYKKYNKDTGEEDYDNGQNLEFIGILPNDDVYSYINNLTESELESLLSSSKNASSDYEIELSLPRFKYDYEVNNLKQVLMELGIKDAFSEESADFTGIMPNDNGNNLYIGTAIHKTHIDLNEKGTKAAAVTFFGLYTSGLHMPKDNVKIAFNKPFVYMIRDQKTKEILFFGTVYEPNEWSGTTCSKES